MTADIDALIDRVLELDAEATAGPWDAARQWESEHASRPIDCEVWTRENILGCASVVCCEKGRDIALVAEYRTLCPQLARECQRLRERVAKLEKQLNEYDSLFPDQYGYK